MFQNIEISKHFLLCGKQIIKTTQHNKYDIFKVFFRKTRKQKNPKEALLGVRRRWDFCNITNIEISKHFFAMRVHTSEARKPYIRKVTKLSRVSSEAERKNAKKFYSVRSATTGSFFAALLEGMIPEKRVRITLIRIRTRAAGRGR